MICDLCKQNTATVRLVAMMDGVRLEKNLCAGCVAKQRTQLRTEGVQSMLSAIIEGMPRAKSRHPGVHCSACGLEYDDFLKTDRLGCTQCYKDFFELLRPMLLRIHGHATHVGRAPGLVSDQLAASGQVERLRRQLEVAIAMEEFETAAELRDELKKMTQEVKGGGVDA